jgi:aminoglycoside phosphotransferase (APT) family kinase protein
VTQALAEADLARFKGALEAYLSEAAGGRSLEVQAVRPLTGGAIQENWLLEVIVESERRDLVLRSDAASTVAASHGRAAEFALLKAARAAGVTVPKPLWLCTDTAVLGRPFYVMERVQGTAEGRLIVKPDGPGGNKDALAERLGEELAKIHAITPPRPDLDFLDLPKVSPALDAVTRYRGYLDAIGRPFPGLEWGLRWAQRHAPPQGEIVLLHQDFRTGNFLVDHQGLTGILDWEFAAWGEPMSDLGWFCARCWRFGQDEKEAGGIASRAPFYGGYERVSGRPVDPDAVAYWEVMAHLRWAVIALQQGERHLTGGERSLELALTGRRAAELELAVLAATAPETWRIP